MNVRVAFYYLFVFCVFVSVINCDADLDGELSDLLIEAERNFSASLETVPSSPRIGVVTVTFPNTTLPLDTGTFIHLTDIRLVSQIPNILNITPNFAFLNIAVKIHLGSPEVKSNFLITSAQSSFHIDGTVRLVIYNTVAEGFADVTLDNVDLYATGVNLKYTWQSVKPIIKYAMGNDEDSHLTDKLIESVLVKNVKSQITVLDGVIQKNLNKVLRDINSVEAFGNIDIAHYFNRYVSDQQGNINTFLDTLLSKFRPLVPVNVSIDDIQQSFSTRVLYIPLWGNFNATNGIIGNLKTLRRTSDVFLNVSPDKIYVMGAMGLKTLEVDYDYDATFLNIGPSGHLRAKVGNNSLSFALRILYDGDKNCSAHVDDIKLEEFSDLEVKFTGLGPLNWLGSKISTWVVNKSSNKLAKIIEDIIENNISDVFNKYGVCRFFQNYN